MEVESISEHCPSATDDGHSQSFTPGCPTEPTANGHIGTLVFKEDKTGDEEERVCEERDQAMI